MPSRDELTKAWGDSVLGRLRGRAKALFGAGRFVSVEDGTAVFSLPNPAHRDRCVACQPEVEQALAAHFGRPVPLRLVAEVGPADGAASDDDDAISIAELRDAPAGPTTSPTERLKQKFPGAEEVES